MAVNAAFSDYNKASTEAPIIHSAQSILAALVSGTAAFVLAPVGFAEFVAVEEGPEDGLLEVVVFVEFSCSNGTMTASRMCMSPL